MAGFSSFLPGLIQTGLGLAGLVGSRGGGGSNTAARAAQHLQGDVAGRTAGAQKLLFRQLVDRFKMLQDEGVTTPEILEQEALGGQLRDIALANLARQETGTAERLSRQFARRGLLGSGLETEAQRQVATEFGFQRAQVSTQEALNRVLRRLQDIRDLESRLQGFAAPGSASILAGLPTIQQQQASPSPLSVLGGRLFGEGISSLFSPNRTTPSPQVGPTPGQFFGAVGSAFGLGQPQQPTTEQRIGSALGTVAGFLPFLFPR